MELRAGMLGPDPERRHALLALRHDKGVPFLGPHASGVPKALNARVILVQAQPGRESLERPPVNVEMVGVEQASTGPQQGDVSVETVPDRVLGLIHPTPEAEAVTGVNDGPQARRHEHRCR